MLVLTFTNPAFPQANKCSYTLLPLPARKMVFPRSWIYFCFANASLEAGGSCFRRRPPARRDLFREARETVVLVILVHFLCLLGDAVGVLVRCPDIIAEWQPPRVD